jgi:hypothetical protein
MGLVRALGGTGRSICKNIMNPKSFLLSCGSHHDGYCVAAGVLSGR